MGDASGPSSASLRPRSSAGASTPRCRADRPGTAPLDDLPRPRSCGPAPCTALGIDVRSLLSGPARRPADLNTRMVVVARGLAGLAGWELLVGLERILCPAPDMDRPVTFVSRELKTRGRQGSGDSIGSWFRRQRSRHGRLGPERIVPDHLAVHLERLAGGARA